MSNAHARISATGKRRMMKATVKVTVHHGSPRLGRTMSATCRTTNEVAP